VTRGSTLTIRYRPARVAASPRIAAEAARRAEDADQRRFEQAVARELAGDCC